MEEVQGMIEASCQAQGLTIDSWEEDADGLTARLGRWFVDKDEGDWDGLIQGDVGDLRACVVGAAEYGNQRVCFTFTPDGYDGGDEVRDLSILSPHRG